MDMETSDVMTPETTTKFQQMQVPSVFNMLVLQIRRVSACISYGKCAAAKEILLFEKLNKQYGVMMNVWKMYQTLLNVHGE